MITAMSDKKLKSLIKESVKEVLETELMKLRAVALPGVLDDEQGDIEERYGAPRRQKERSYDVEV